MGQESLRDGQVSVAVGIECAGGTWLAADSCISAENQRFTLAGAPKVFTLCGGRVGVAICGYPKMSQDLRYRTKLKPPAAGADPEQWLARTFIPVWGQLLSEHIEIAKLVGGAAAERDPGEACSVVLVALLGQVWSVDEGLSLCRARDGYAAAGAGVEYALGALHATPGDDPVVRVDLAVEAAAAYCPSVGLPVERVWVSSSPAAEKRPRTLPKRPRAPRPSK